MVLIDQPAVMVVFVLPGDERTGPGPRILHTPKALRVVGAVFERLELGFSVWVIIGHVRPTVRFGDTQVRK